MVVTTGKLERPGAPFTPPTPDNLELGVSILVIQPMR